MEQLDKSKETVERIKAFLAELDDNNLALAIVTYCWVNDLGGHLPSIIVADRVPAFETERLNKLATTAAYLQATDALSQASSKCAAKAKEGLRHALEQEAGSATQERSGVEESVTGRSAADATASLSRLEHPAD